MGEIEQAVFEDNKDIIILDIINKNISRKFPHLFFVYFIRLDYTNTIIYFGIIFYAKNKKGVFIYMILYSFVKLKN